MTRSRRERIKREQSAPPTPSLLRVFGKFRFEMEQYNEKNKVLLLSGVRRIIRYTPTELIFDTGGEILTLTGENLLCRTYTSGALDVIGVIRTCSFGKEAEGDHASGT